MKHPLLGRFDLDPGRWRPLYYGVEITVGRELDMIGTGAINLNNQPYILTEISHAIIGCTGDPATGLYQDGQYTILFKDEQTVYQNQPIQADMLYGSVRVGHSKPLPFPIPFAGNKVLTFEVVNRCLRVFVPEREDFVVGITLAGVADFGPLDSEGGAP